MTAATQDVITPRYGAEDQVLPELLQFPVAAATTIYGGTMVMINSSGYAVPAAAATSGAPGIIVGRCQRQVVNTTAAGFGAAGALQVLVDRGAFWYALNADSTVTIANFGQNVYASDDSTLSTSDGGGTRPFAGYLLCSPATPGIPGLLNGTASTKVAAQIGQPNPWSASSASPTLSTVGKARAVVTTLQAYGGTGTNVLTETSNGAISAADGVTLVAGDIVFIQGGTTNLTGAVDSGPWQVTSLGGSSAKWVLTRPDWFETGAVVPLGQVIEVGGEGSVWHGTQWKSLAASGSAVIGTNDPTFYVGRLSQAVALVASTKTITNVGLYSASTSAVITQFQAAGGTTTSTIGYGVITAPTPGYAGTASIVVDALASGMGKNGSSDTSTVVVTVINW